MNLYEVLIIIVLVLACIIAIISIRRNKGKCSSCSLSSSCPFKKD